MKYAEGFFSTAGTQALSRLWIQSSQDKRIHSGLEKWRFLYDFETWWRHSYTARHKFGQQSLSSFKFEILHTVDFSDAIPTD